RRGLDRAPGLPGDSDERQDRRRCRERFRETGARNRGREMTMSQDTSLLPALEIAAFERRKDGSFSPVAAPPAWFNRIIADGVFPFLGHILEEANQFWTSRAPGRRDWGPCAELDESGTEFHYIVSALTAGDRQYLVFQLDPGSDRMRQMLQQVRERAL